MRITCREMARLQEDVAAQSQFQEWLEGSCESGPRLRPFSQKRCDRDPEGGFDLWLALYIVWVCRDRVLQDSEGSRHALSEYRPWFGSLTLRSRVAGATHASAHNPFP